MVPAGERHAPGWGKQTQNLRTTSESGHDSESEMFLEQHRLSSPGGSVQQVGTRLRKLSLKSQCCAAVMKILGRWDTGPAGKSIWTLAASQEIGSRTVWTCTSASL